MFHIPFLQQNKLRKLVHQYDHFVFVSPHLDDAVLSCGYLLEKLKEANKNILIITVFTKCTKVPPTPQAINFIEICGYDSGLHLFKNREKEDIEALKIFSAQHAFLGFTDAAWRLDRKRLPIYKTQKIQFSGRISMKDKHIINNIKQELKKYLQYKNSLILAPLGVGNHVDHVIINNIVRKFKQNAIFWEDFPYNRNKNDVWKGIKRANAINIFTIKNSKNELKEKAIKKYKSQIKSIFSLGKISKIKESYYARENSRLY